MDGQAAARPEITNGDLLGAAQSTLIALTAALAALLGSVAEATPQGPQESHAEGHAASAQHDPEAERWLEEASSRRDAQADPTIMDELLQDEERRTAAAVAACESGHRQPDGTATPHTHDWQAQNERSTASGAFQFIDGTWEWVWNAFLGEEPPTRTAGEAPPRQQLQAFKALWRNGEGAHHWDASRSCWQPMLRSS